MCNKGAIVKDTLDGQLVAVDVHNIHGGGEHDHAPDGKQVRLGNTALGRKGYVSSAQLRVLAEEIDQASDEGTMSTMKRMGNGVLLLDRSCLVLLEAVDYVHDCARCASFWRFGVKCVGLKLGGGWGDSILVVKG